MVAFDEVRRAARADNRLYQGSKMVEVSKIVGSVGRHTQFDGRFMPTKASASKWKRVDRAFRRGVDLPPASLYKIGNSYFVHDGNHRVSVARHRGQDQISAYVTELTVDGPLPAELAAPAADAPQGFLAALAAAARRALRPSNDLATA